MGCGPSAPKYTITYLSPSEAARAALAASSRPAAGAGAGGRPPSLGALGRSASSKALGTGFSRGPSSGRSTLSPSKVAPDMSEPTPTPDRGKRERAPRLTRHMRSLSSQHLSTPPPGKAGGSGHRGSMFSRSPFDRSSRVEPAPARTGSFSVTHSQGRGYSATGGGAGGVGTARRATAHGISSTVVQGLLGGAPSPLGNLELLDFDVGPVIGRGGYAYVRIAEHRATSSWVALKCVKKKHAINRGTIADLQQERSAAEALSKAGNPWVAHFHGSFQDANAIYMAFDFLCGGELYSRLRSMGRFTTEVARFYAAEVLLALQAVHRCGFAYRDLKPENVMIDKQGHVKLVDFGFTVPASAVRRLYRRVGTANYLAPEMLDKDVKQLGYTRVVDWWAFGCMLYEMLVGKAAFGKPGDPSHGIYMRIMSGKTSVPGRVDRHAADLIRQLLCPDMKRRLVEPEDMKSHAFFSGIDWECMSDFRAVPPFVPPMSGAGDTSHFDVYSTSVDAKAADRWNKLRSHVKGGSPAADFSVF